MEPQWFKNNDHGSCLLQTEKRLIAWLSIKLSVVCQVFSGSAGYNAIGILKSSITKVTRACFQRPSVADSFSGVLIQKVRNRHLVRHPFSKPGLTRWF